MQDLNRSGNLILAEQQSLLLRRLPKKRVCTKCIWLAHLVTFSLSHINHEKLLGPKLRRGHRVRLKCLRLSSLLHKRLHHIFFLFRIEISPSLLDCILKPLCPVLILALFWRHLHRLLVFVSRFHPRGMAGCALKCRSVQIERMLVNVCHLEHIRFMLDVKSLGQDQSWVAVHLLQRNRLYRGRTLILMFDVAKQN